MSNRYTVDPTNFIVEIFNDIQDAPFLRQPNYPSGDAWESEQDAASWAELYIASIEDEAAPFAPMAPGEAGHPRPTAEQIAEWDAIEEARRNPTT